MISSIKLKLLLYVELGIFRITRKHFSLFYNALVLLLVYIIALEFEEMKDFLRGCLLF
jgi:hypothetical protein